MVEIITAITDYILAILNIIFAYLLYEKYLKNKKSIKLMWIGMFISLSLGSLFGGIYHGTEWEFKTFLWGLTVYTLGFSLMFLLTGTILTLFPKNKKIKYLVIIYFLVYLLFLYIFNKAFIVFVIYEILGLSFVLLVYTFIYLKNNKNTFALYMISAIIVSIIAAIIQASNITIFLPFTHNDIFHMIQMFGLWLFYMGMR